MAYNLVLYEVKGERSKCIAIKYCTKTERERERERERDTKTERQRERDRQKEEKKREREKEKGKPCLPQSRVSQVLL